MKRRQNCDDTGWLFGDPCPCCDAVEARWAQSRVRRVGWALLAALALLFAALPAAGQTLTPAQKAVVGQAERAYRSMGMSTTPRMNLATEARWHLPPPGEEVDWRAWLGGWSSGYRAWFDGFDHSCHPVVGMLDGIADASPLIRPWKGDTRLMLNAATCSLVTAWNKAGAGPCPALRLPLTSHCSLLDAYFCADCFYGRCADETLLSAYRAKCGPPAPPPSPCPDPRPWCDALTGDQVGRCECVKRQEPPPPPPPPTPCGVCSSGQLELVVEQARATLAAAEAALAQCPEVTP